MPFDTTTKPDTETAALLRKARALVDTPEKWCQNALALDAKGKHQSPSSDGVVSMCVRGALIRASCKFGWDSVSSGADRALEAVARQMGFRGFAPHVDLNNTTNHPTVMRMFDRAIELAREEG